MKRVAVFLLIVTGVVFAAGFVFAEDFSHYSNDRLMSMRHSMHDASPERQLEYRQEMRRRFGVEVNIGVHSDHHDDFWDDMDDHHNRYHGGGSYWSDHHDQNHHRGYYYRSYHRRGGGGC